MTIELFPTAWSFLATSFVLGAVGLAAGIWIGKISADRSAFKEFMTHTRQEMKELRNGFIQSQDGMNGVRNEVNEIRSGLNEVRSSLSDVRNDVNKV